MWKLLVLTALVCAVTAQRPGGGGMVSLEQNLTAVWERVHELEEGGSCRPQITMHVHGPGGKGGRRGGHHGRHSGSHEDHGEDHAEGHEESHEEGEHSESHEHGHGRHGHHEDGAHVHLHLHMGGPGMGGHRDIYHSNPIPWAHTLDVDSVHAVCHMHAASHDISGQIHLKQSFMGHDDVELDFALAGFNAEAHDHTFFVHRYGCLSNACANIGAVFTPPHGKPGGHGHHDSDEHDEHDEPDVEHANRKRRSHHGHHGAEDGRTEGVIGTLGSDEHGEMHQDIESDAITLIGMHSIIGRSIAIHQADDTDGTGEPLACCVVGWNDGSHFGDESDHWLPGEGDHEDAHAH